MPPPTRLLRENLPSTQKGQLRLIGREDVRSQAISGCAPLPQAPRPPTWMATCRESLQPPSVHRPHVIDKSLNHTVSANGPSQHTQADLSLPDRPESAIGTGSPASLPCRGGLHTQIPALSPVPLPGETGRNHTSLGPPDLFPVVIMPAHTGSPPQLLVPSSQHYGQAGFVPGRLQWGPSTVRTPAHFYPLSSSPLLSFPGAPYRDMAGIGSCFLGAGGFDPSLPLPRMQQPKSLPGNPQSAVAFALFGTLFFFSHPTQGDFTEHARPHTYTESPKGVTGSALPCPWPSRTFGTKHPNPSALAYFSCCDVLFTSCAHVGHEAMPPTEGSPVSPKHARLIT